MSRALKPDAQAFDEVRITTVPRWKESEMSGSEWRISARIEFLRNGEVKHETSCSDIKTACYLVGAEHMRACDKALGYFAGEGVFCDQEGCAKKAVVTYRLKAEYCRQGHKSEPTSDSVRMFCSNHKERGDCGLEDADSNYEVVKP